MKKTLCLIILSACLVLTSTVYAGGYGHHGGGYRGYGWGGHGGYYGGGYYGGHGYYGGCGWNGAYYALGIATAVIGTALIVDALNRPCTAYSYAPPPVYSYGHWEVQRTWVPGSAQRYWVNQYYDPNRNVWVLGHWEERPGWPGYWQETRVWVQ
jgi:hypothetical protein